MNKQVIVGVVIAGVAFIIIGIAMAFGPTMLEGFEDMRTASNVSEYTALSDVIEAGPTLILLGFIISVGIGGFMGSHGCWPMVPISDPDVRWMNRVFDRAGDALRRATSTVGGTFIDANRRSAGHDPCNLIAPWYESSLSNGSLAYPYHINQQGAVAIAAMVNGAIRR